MYKKGIFYCVKICLHWFWTPLFSSYVPKNVRKDKKDKTDVDQAHFTRSDTNMDKLHRHLLNEFIFVIKFD